MKDLVQLAQKASSAELSRRLGKSGSRFKLENTQYDIILAHAQELKNKPHMKTCFEIFEENMKQIYESSESGYSAQEKIKEMRDPEGKFLLVLGKDDMVVGFLIWRFDWEETMGSDDVEVAYCYELQFRKDACGNGLGRALMNLLEEIGKSWKMKKVMLTVHKTNTRALSFYLNKMNYEFDEISPSQVEGADPADYEIMSKRLSI